MIDLLRTGVGSGPEGWGLETDGSPQGMNFAEMPSVQNHSDILFWQIVLPVMVVVLPWSLWGDIVWLFKLLGRVRLLNRVEQKEARKAHSARRAEKRRRTLGVNEKGS